MGNKAYHSPVSGYWLVLVPAVLFGVAYYAYTTPGWLGLRVQHWLRPIVDPAIRFFGRIF